MTHPLQDLRREREQARDRADPCTDLCCLGTLSDDATPALRTLVLRDVTDTTVAVFCSRSSPKARHLLANGACELMIFWPTVRSQYRIRGGVEEIPGAEIRENWVRRPWESKLLDHLYASERAQSTPVASRQDLVDAIDALKERFPDPDSVPFPDGPTGFRVRAVEVEIWRESPDRLHDRRRHVLAGSAWQEQILVP